MIAVLVCFRYESGFSEARVRQVADAARAKFEGMPGLRSKAFTIDPVNREALNFYVWESEEAAKAQAKGPAWEYKIVSFRGANNAKVIEHETQKLTELAN